MKKSFPLMTGAAFRNTLRGLALLLLIVAIFGPWGYSGDGVPPPEYCGPPLILLESPQDGTLRCMRFLPGTEVFALWGMVLVYLPRLIFSAGSNMMEGSREFLFVLVGLVLFILPIFSTISVLISRETSPARKFNAVAWGLALIPALMIVLLMPYAQDWRLWGILLYSATAAAILLLELLNGAFKPRGSSIQDLPGG